MIYLITAVHNHNLIPKSNKKFFKHFLGLKNDFKSIIVLDNFKLNNVKLEKNFDKVISTNKELFFFGSIIYGLKKIGVKKKDRIIIYNIDSIIIDEEKLIALDFNEFYENEVICGRFLNNKNQQSYGAWEENKSFISPRIHNNIYINISNKSNFNYVCNSNLLSISGDIILEILNDKIPYKQTYFDYVATKVACRKRYPLRIVDIPIVIERHDKDIKNKYLDNSSKYFGIESPFNPLLIGLRIRLKYFKRTLLSFFFYRIYLSLRSLVLLKNKK